MINRSVLIVRPKQPYTDWAAGLDDSGIVPDVQGEQTVYLIPNYVNDDDAQEIIAQIYGQLFDNQLWSWHTDESAWPKNRDFKTFQEWFTIELHSVVEDLCGYEIFDEDDE